MKKMFLWVLLIVLIGSFSIEVSFADTIELNNKSAVLRYIKDNNPTELTIMNTKIKPMDLLEIKNALPDGAPFHFTTKWGNIIVSDDITELDLRQRKGNATAKDLDAIAQLCPDLELVDNTGSSSITNKDMGELIEKYPNIQFEWIVHLGKSHTISTKASAYSTYNHIGDSRTLTSKNLQALKYCPRLKALDLGHNLITDLDFLQYVPDLELLIVGDNRIKDLTPISQLKHLQYAELFSNYFTDITPLAECTELLDLNICYCQVTDFSSLDNLGKLQRFWATNIRHLPEEQKTRFKEAHPLTEVDFTGPHATSSGWRQHPRYSHYIWCFKNHTWIPFNQEIPEE